MKRERGFTLVEVIVAILVLTVGLLALVTSSALVTRMIQRGQRSAVSSNYGAQQLEQLRVTACTARAAGSNVMWRGDVPVDSISWRWVDAGNKQYRIVLRSTYITQPGQWRTDSTETQISCQF